MTKTLGHEVIQTDLQFAAEMPESPELVQYQTFHCYQAAVIKWRNKVASLVADYRLRLEDHK